MLGALSLLDVAGLVVALAILILLLVWVFQSHERRWSRPGRVTLSVGGWRWQGQPRASFVLLKRVFWLYFVAAMVAVGSITTWAPRKPDSWHQVPFTMRDGQVYYIQRWFARAIDFAIPVGCVLFVGLVLLGSQIRRRAPERHDPGAG